MTHTKGPWNLSFEDYGDEWWFGGEAEGQYIVKGNNDLDSTEGVIACGPLWRDETPSKAAECEANARLIAVAPDLLASLEKIIPYAAMYDPAEYGGEEPTQDVDIAQALTIVKAAKG